MEKITKYFKFFVLSGIILFTVGCTNSEETGNSAEKSEGEQNVRAVLEKIFTGPNEEQEEILQGSIEDLDKYAKRLSEYQETFKPYTTEKFFEGFVNTNGALKFLQMAHPNYELKVDEITLEERESNEGDYDFTVKVSYTNKESDESETMNVEGRAYTNEDGKLTSIRYMNFEEVRDALEERKVKQP
ncbi:hypothetical protein [Halobacillus amylolyticus]|uniref:Lipoprotein n=1 Tax=Halobacillus amylolyticus TaxID=2932259 RepID=A0ABY4HHA2_9BACI|nr:hypothetical protein [Halobacillus amylolyticus]UOR12815.1 hypothetical protein MUO15_04680 [Halobacillus amylolyticus]